LLAAGRPPEPGEQGIDSRTGSYFAFVLAAHSIGHGKQPTVSILFRDFGEHATEIVFVVVAYSPAVGSLSDLKI
jgi:hypothetical protein